MDVNWTNYKSEDNCRLLLPWLDANAKVKRRELLIPTGIGKQAVQDIYCLEFIFFESEHGAYEIVERFFMEELKLPRPTSSSILFKTRTMVEMSGLNTGGAQADDDSNMITLQFQAVLCDLPEVSAG